MRLPFQLSISPLQKKFLKTLGILLLALLIPLLLMAVRQRIEIRKRAAAGSVRFLLVPSSKTLTLEGEESKVTAEVWVNVSNPDNPDNGAVSAQSVINFEKDYLNLLSITPKTDVFGTTISATSVQDANNEGRIILIQGLSPTQKESVIGTYKIAEIKFQAIAPTGSLTGDNVSFYINPADFYSTKVANAQAGWMEVTSAGARYEVTPAVATPTPTPTPTPADLCNTCTCAGSGYETITCSGDTVYVDCNADKCWTPTAGSPYPWANALTYCATTQDNYGGKTDWVLPDLATLQNLCNSGSCSGTCFGGEGVSHYYWSSAGYDINAYRVLFSGCVTHYGPKSSYLYVRCVRGAGVTPTPTPTPGIATSVVRAKFYDPKMNPVEREVCLARFQCDDYGDTKSRYWGKCRTTTDYQETIYYSETYNCYGVRTPVMPDLQGVTPSPESGFVSHPSTRRGSGSFYGWPWEKIPEGGTVTFIVAAAPSPTPTTTPKPKPTPTPTTTPGPTVTPTKTPTPSPTPPPGTPLLDFAVKFQGIRAGRSEPGETMSQTVKVKVKESRGKMHQFSGVKLVYDPKTGFYSPEAAIPLVDVPKGDGYTIYIKGPKHLQKRFCSDGQTKRCLAGQGAISLVAGENTLDFSGLALEAGDLPNPNAEPQQDGVVNSIDVALLRKHYCRKKAEYGFRACTQEDLRVADLDLDGYVYDSDLQLIRNTLSAIYEDEE